MLIVFCSPAFAARPLLDQRQWDAYFALSARDVVASWRPATVRLATYSGAPVDFTVYEADPVDVLVAGASRSRALDLIGRKPLARWRYDPPAGFRFQENDVTVPIGQREGFFVVEARRGEATEQVWLNHTRLGLLTKEGPLGLTAWCVDLRTGRSQQNIRADFLVGRTLTSRTTDRSGLIEWRGGARPRFVLASAGASKAFVSLLPQSPLPATVVSVRLDTGVVRAGGTVHVVGFARKRSPGGFRNASGEARISLVTSGRTLTSTTVQLDGAGAFAGDISIPPSAPPGDDVVVASVGGAVGATGLRVDAVDETALTLVSDCPCEANHDVTLTVLATRHELVAPGVAVHMQVVRSPHILPPGTGDDAVLWGTAAVFDRTVHTDATGRAHVTLPAPSDGLASTYGIRATAGGASASSRIAVATSSVALSVQPDAPQAGPGEPVGIAIFAFDAVTGAPKAGESVIVRLTHGTTAEQRSVVADERGRARVSFSSAPLGTNLVSAAASAGGTAALDVSAVTVVPGAAASASAGAESDVRITLDRARYRPGERANVHAHLDGAAGDVLLTIEGARAYQSRVSATSNGSASATLDVGDPLGDARAGAAFVRDGAIVDGSVPLSIDGPGHVRATSLSLDAPVVAGAHEARALFHDNNGGAATVALSVSDGRPGASSSFLEAPNVLLAGGTETQHPAAAVPAWHTFAAPARSRASDIYAAERPRRLATEAPTLGGATPRTRVWRVTRATAQEVNVPLPSERGTYLVSVLKIDDDGDVGAASLSVTVR